jgi:hypothetical protein
MPLIAPDDFEWRLSCHSPNIKEFIYATPLMSVGINGNAKRMNASSDNPATTKPDKSKAAIKNDDPKVTIDIDKKRRPYIASTIAINVHVIPYVISVHLKKVDSSENSSITPTATYVRPAIMLWMQESSLERISTAYMI